MKACIVGDTHGDDSFVAKIHKLIELDRDRYSDPTKGVQVVIQVGDFMLYHNTNMIRTICAWLDKDPTRKWFWLDGNHDHHDYIREVILDGYHTREAPVPHWHERMFYCPRGSTTRIGDANVMFLGGAYSIDKSDRKPHISYFEAETIGAGDMYNAFQHKDPVDVMFTHDTVSTKVLYDFLTHKIDYQSEMNRVNLGRVVDEIKPKMLIHGHYHRRYSTVYTSTEGYRTLIEGLGANYDHFNRKVDPICDQNYLFMEL